MITFQQQDNGKNGRFLLFEDGKKAGELVYQWNTENELLLEHTEVDAHYGGKGYGKDLVLKAVDFAREKNLKLRPECSYAKKVLERDDSYQDILARS